MRVGIEFKVKDFVVFSLQIGRDQNEYGLILLLAGVIRLSISRRCC